MMTSSPGKIITIVLGLILIILGGLPLLNQIGVIGFSLPAMPSLLLWILFVLGGVWLLATGFKEGVLNPGSMWASIIVGIIILALGVIPVLNELGVIGFALPPIAKIVVDVIMFIAGLLLLIGGVKQGVWF